MKDARFGRFSSAVLVDVPEWRNWQTRALRNRMPKGVWVQIPRRARPRTIDTVATMTNFPVVAKRMKPGEAGLKAHDGCRRGLCFVCNRASRRLVQTNARP